MRLTAAIIAGLVGAAVAFAPQPNLARRSAATSAALRMSTEAVPITVTGNNIEVTPALQDYVVKKLERTVGKLASSGAVKDCDVHLIVNKNPKVRLELLWTGGAVRKKGATPHIWIDRVMSQRNAHTNSYAPRTRIWRRKSQADGLK